MNQIDTPGVYEETWLETPDGVSLFCRQWKSQAASRGDATLVFVHGACEHGGRHVGFAEKAARAGWSVILPDLRGHGKSTGPVVHVERFEQYLEDLRVLFGHYGLDPERTVILGNSMGGLISIRWNQWQAAHAGQPGCARLCLVSPLLGIRHPIPEWKKSLAHLLGTHFPQTRFRSTINPADLTHDEEVLRQRREDPLLRRAVTARWYLEIDRALGEVFRQLNGFAVPTDIYQAGEDRIVDPLAARAWADLVNRHTGDSLVSFRLFPGWYHELLKETQAASMHELILSRLEPVLQACSPV
ncbi:MAG: alpha/beta hydrolase [Planctomycetaceae bacterium]|nr:lysophospholipase [Planctomycetaceae bacterium]